MSDRRESQDMFEVKADTVDNLKSIKKRISNLEEKEDYRNIRLDDLISYIRFQNIFCVVLVIAIAFAFLIHFNVVKSNKAILILYMVSDSDTENISDKTQVDNALKRGGMVCVLTTREGYKNAFGNSYIDFGAENAENYVLMEGAAVNYIISHGWSLVQAPSSLVQAYYFEKSVYWR